MASNVALEFKTEKLRADWERRCREVLQHFNLPDRRLLCGFDEEKSDWFQSIGHRDARGLHCLTQGSGLWPDFLESRRYEGATAAFDSLVYIPMVPPTDAPFVFVVTFAHELQHFVQYWTEPRISLANNLFYENLSMLDPSIPSYETWHVPTERDAMIKSKQVAVSLFKQEGVQGELRSLMSNDNVGKEWEYFQGLSSSATRNLRDETDHLVKQYQNEILAHRSIWPPGIDFTTNDWWK